MLNICYFEKFKGVPTLLFAGSRTDMEKLFEFFRTWTGERVDIAEALGQGTEIRLGEVFKLVLDRSSSGPSSVAEMVGGICEWRVSDSWKDVVAGLLQGLVESESASHQYLDSGETGLQILCTKDEYQST